VGNFGRKIRQELCKAKLTRKRRGNLPISALEHVALANRVMEAPDLAKNLDEPFVAPAAGRGFQGL
jgi:hypothetical protein